MADSEETLLKEITIYTDGGAEPNPGRGGYGVVLRFGEHAKELSGGFELTTNNRMELMAVIVGLEALKERCRVTLYSDSRYVIDAIEKGSAFKWRKRGWAMNATGTKLAKNPDLWERLLCAYDKHDVELIWVKGHAGIEDNERCDQLAAAALRGDNLPADDGYVPSPNALQPKVESKVAAPGTSKKTKMTEVGQPCRKCETEVIKRVPKKKTVKPNQTHYYAWYLYCPGCKALYLVEEAKRQVSDDGGRLFGE